MSADLQTTIEQTSEKAIKALRDVSLQSFRDEILQTIKMKILYELNKPNITDGFGMLGFTGISNYYLANVGSFRLVAANGFVYAKHYNNMLSTNDDGLYTWEPMEPMNAEMRSKHDSIIKDFREGKIKEPYPIQKLNHNPTTFKLAPNEYPIIVSTLGDHNWFPDDITRRPLHRNVLLTNMFNIYVRPLDSPNTIELFHLSSWPMPDDFICRVVDDIKYITDCSRDNVWLLGNGYVIRYDCCGHKTCFDAKLLNRYLMDLVTKFWPRRPDAPIALAIAERDKAMQQLQEKLTVITAERDMLLSNTGRNQFAEECKALAAAKTKFLSDSGQADFAKQRDDLKNERVAFDKERVRFASASGQDELRLANARLVEAKLDLVNAQRQFESASGQTAFKKEKDLFEATRASFTEQQRIWEASYQKRQANIDAEIQVCLKREIALRFPIDEGRVRRQTGTLGQPSIACTAMPVLPSPTH